MTSELSISRVGVRARQGQQRATDTRRQVLDAVLTILSDKGFSALTNAAIITKTGISSGALMHHFPTRQKLLADTIEYAYEKLFAFRNQQLERLDPGMPRFRAVIDLSWHMANMKAGFTANEVRIGVRSDTRSASPLRPVFKRIAEDYARFVGSLVGDAGLVPDEEMQGLWTVTSMTMRSLAIDRKTYTTSDVAAKALLVLRTMREAFIVRQLGRGAGQDPHIAWMPA